MGGQEAYSDGC